uniref:Uncharacterized protein n=1 Tax=Anabas testudineus TaxID=64144 RepID=A0A7N6B9D9_ANATE
VFIKYINQEGTEGLVSKYRLHLFYYFVELADPMPTRMQTLLKTRGNKALLNGQNTNIWWRDKGHIVEQRTSQDPTELHD